MTPKALSRTREEIEKDYNDCVQELKDENVGTYEARSLLRSAMADVLCLEVLLDIRDLLTKENK